MTILNNAWNWYSQALENLWNSEIAAFIIKIFVLLLALSVLRNVIKIVCEAIVSSGKKFYQDLRDAGQKSILSKCNVDFDISKEIENAPLIKTRSFLWDATVFFKTVTDAYATFLPFQIPLIKAGLIFVLPSKYILNYFKGVIVATDTVSSSCKDIVITVSSFVVIPNKLTYAEILYENTSDKDVSFKIAKDKISNIVELSLYNKNGAQQKVTYAENDNEDFLSRGTLLPKQRVTAKVVFKTINRSTVHSTKTYEICGSLRFLGSRSYEQYTLTLNNLTTSEEACIQRIKSLFDECDLFTVFKCGGIAFVASLLILVLFVTSIFCAALWARILCFVIALAILLFSIPTNIAVIQYIYDNHSSKTS